MADPAIDLELENSPEVQGEEPEAEAAGDTPEEPSGQEPEQDADAPEADAAPSDEPDESKPVPVKSFVAYKKKWTAEKQALQAKAADLEKRQRDYEAKLAKATAAGEVDPQEYRLLKALVSKFQEAGKKLPEFGEAFYAIQEGIDPDLRRLHQALDARVKTLSTLDPATQARIHQMEIAQRELQQQASELRFERRKNSEDAEIKALYKGADDAALAKLMSHVNDVARNAVENMPEEVFVRHMPSRVAIAKALLGFSTADREALLKSQKVTSAVKNNAALPRAGGGKAGSAAPKAPSMNPEDPKFIEWLMKQKELQ